MQALLGRLNGARRSGDGWSALCPAHDDRHPSLSIGLGDNGRILLNCHAGCSRAEVLEAMGLSEHDLTLQEASGSRGPAAVIYEYLDRARQLIYQVLRYVPKSFVARRPDGQGGWIWNLGGVRRVPYRLPDLIAAVEAAEPGHREVCVAEGEKDADRLWSTGIPATTNACGGGQWTDDLTQQLKEIGVEVVAVLEDNDRAGAKRTEAVARSCHAAGLRVKAVELPGLPARREKGGEDVSDWLDAGHGADQLKEVIRLSPELGPADLVARRGAARGLVFTRLGDLLAEPPEQVSWFIEGLLKAGGFSVLAGKPKSGKSTLARCLAFCAARGLRWLGRPVTQGPVLYVALEDLRSEIARSFAEMGADGADPLHLHIGMSPDNALTELQAKIERERPVLVVLDPMIKFLRIWQPNDYGATTLALEPVLGLARDTGAHILGVHHLGKGQRTGADAILGSTAIHGAVDVALLMHRTGSHVTLSSEASRYGEPFGPITLDLDPDTGMVTAGQAAQEVSNRWLFSAIAECLDRMDGPVTEPEIIKRVPGSKASVEVALREMVKAGDVARQGEGKRGSPYLYTLAEVPMLTNVWLGYRH